MTTDYSLAREHMVLSQLQPSGVITPAILDAFLAIPRELFVPPAKRDFCYTDDNLDLQAGRGLLEPMVFGKMLEAVQIQKTDNVLCIGGASGYGAAVVSLLADRVVDLEADDMFGTIQHAAVDELGISNIQRMIGDFRTGAAARGPYDVIILEGAVVMPPSKLLEQLARGGRMIGIVVKERATIGQVTIFQKSAQDQTVSSRPLFDAWSPYLAGCGPVPRFAFN